MGDLFGSCQIGGDLREPQQVPGLGNFLIHPPQIYILDDQFGRAYDTSIMIRKYVMVDVETDGPIPGDYSMIAFGAIIVEPPLDKTYHGLIHPVSKNWMPEALKISGYTREQTEKFHDPIIELMKFETWLKENAGEQPMFVSDNNGFDFMFMCWYFWHFLERCPFGHSSTNLGSLYKGLVKNTHKNFKHLRDTRHSHNPVDDARGNAEAMLKMQNMGIRL